jgi:hypothetical protein
VQAVSDFLDSGACPAISGVTFLIKEKSKGRTIMFLLLFFCLDTKEPKSQGCLNFYCFLQKENPRKQTRPPEADSNSVFLAQAGAIFTSLKTT